MRTLCINLNQAEKPSVAENFLSFSPRVHFRDPGLVFIDVSSTTQLFGGERGLINEAINVCEEFFPQASAAIADTPAAAQVFSSQNLCYVSPPTEETEELNHLPLSSLTSLEGLIAWQSVREVEDIVSFFKLLGLKQIGDIRRFEVESFRERWGHTGTLLWKRLHGLEKQVISPLVPTDSLTDYIHLDFPVSLLSFLLHCLEKSLQRLFARMQGRGEFAQKILVHLYCEYSNKCHLIELMPASPNRDLELFLKLLENKLINIELENPIREIELEIVPCPEKVQQLNFWEPRVREQDKMHQLISVFNQASVTSGYLQPTEDIMPENSWSVASHFEPYETLHDSVESQPSEVDPGRSTLKMTPAYSKSLSQSPRPTRLLEQPKALSEKELGRYHFLSQHPIERLEDSWWEDTRGRDYFWALSPHGENVWIFFDRIEDCYYLHGYFD